MDTELPGRRWLRPADRWRDGALLGNGALGAVVWGDGEPLRIAIDHTAQWLAGTTEPAPPGNDFTTFREAMTGETGGWDDVWPLAAPRSPADRATRLPPSLVEIALDQPLERMEVDLSERVLHLHPASGSEIRIRVERDADVVIASGFRNRPEPSLSLPPEHGLDWYLSSRGAGPVSRATRNDFDAAWLSLPDGSVLGLGAGVTESEDGWSVLMATVLAESDQALLPALDRLLAPSRSSRSGTTPSPASAPAPAPRISVPDPLLQSLWEVEAYKLDAVTRVGGDAIGLQGPWSPFATLPPWGGDYHWNVNVQMSYWPVFALGRTDLLEPLWRLVERCLPQWRDFCRCRFGVDGAFVPHATDADGHPPYDWAVPAFGLGNGLWLAHVLWAHWLYDGDSAVLERVVSLLDELLLPLTGLLEEMDGSRLHLPFSYSPEFPGSSPWGADSAFDLALLRWGLEAAARGHALLGDPVRSAELADLLDRLAPLPVDPPVGPLAAFGDTGHGGLKVRADRSLDRSHRHHSHLVAIHPLHLVGLDSDNADREVALESLRNLVYRGSGEWVGFSVVWAASLAATLGQGDLAWGWLDEYSRHWVTRSSLMVQSPPSGTRPTIWNGLSAAMPDGVTLEAGFGYLNALTELLLQSHDGVVRLFHALPSHWSEASFGGLRAEGGLTVDAAYQDGRVTSWTVVASRDVDTTLRRPGGPDVDLSLRAGQILRHP